MPKKVHVILRRNDKSRLWEAFLARDNAKICHAHSPRAVRSRYTSLLAQQYGEDVEIDDKIELPSEMEQALREHQLLTKRLEEDTKNLRAMRVRLANSLLADLNLGQTETAERLGFAQSYLSKILAEEGTAQHSTPSSGGRRRTNENA